MIIMKQEIEKIIANSSDRYSLCSNLIKKFNCKFVAELGVYRGDFAEKLLSECENIVKYIMIDSWRNLSDWNKPANTNNQKFEEFYQETLRKTDFAKTKREILRGKTTEVIEKVNDNSIDLFYVDGDHTLKGISIDLINIWNKIKLSGFIVGDDFFPTIWQHSQDYEPTMVFPYAVYFAEAVNCKIYGLPFNQFLIAKEENGFEFIDLTKETYSTTELRHQFIRAKKYNLKISTRNRLRILDKIFKNINRKTLK